MKIGLALSGGGYRATVFHLGLLERLARSQKMEDVKVISSVSGGSICAGLVYTAAGNKWPTSEQYLTVVLPAIRKLLLETNLQRSLVFRALLHPLRLFQTRADDLSALMRKQFGLTATMQEIPADPEWIVNAACYETGVMFRIGQERMGDYRSGYVTRPHIPISDAVAASAGFPVGIGPLVLKTGDYDWVNFVEGEGWKAADPQFEKLHLWDGGVYDNLGDEPLFNPGQGLEKNLDFLIISDASGKFTVQKYHLGLQPLKRLLDIATSQVRAVRSRALVGYMAQHPGSGAYLQTGNTCRHILERSPKAAEIEALCPQTLSDAEVDAAAHMGTHIHKLTQDDFQLLFRHGFEVANATLFAHGQDAFDWLSLEG